MNVSKIIQAQVFKLCYLPLISLQLQYQVHSTKIKRMVQVSHKNFLGKIYFTTILTILIMWLRCTHKEYILYNSKYNNDTQSLNKISG